MLEGHTINNLLIFGDLNNGAVAKGYKIQLPFLGNSHDKDLNEWHDKLRCLLKNLSEEEMLHIYWKKDSDYHEALENYGKKTKSSVGFEKNYRERRENYFKSKLEKNQLQRSETYVYISKKLNNNRKFFSRRKHLEREYSTILEQNNQSLSLWKTKLQNSFGQWTHIQEQKDDDNYWLLRQIFDPRSHSGNKNNALISFDPNETVDQNCLYSTGVTTQKEHMRFFFGGNYHSIFVMKRWPKVTYPGMILEVLNRVPGLMVNANIFATNNRQEAADEKRQLKRLIRMRTESDIDVDLDVAIEKKKQKIQDLATGNVKTFNVELIFCLKADTEEKIAKIEETFRNAILGLDGAEILEPDLDLVANTLFFHTLPGYINADQEKDFCIYAQDEYLADMLPLYSTFNCFLEDPEALYDGSLKNLVGLKTFYRGSPQHSLLFGMTGAGKSVFMEDFLTQTMPYFDYTVIIEEGLSYKNFTQSMGEEPIILHPNYKKTLNVFDTFGLPLMPENIGFVATFVANLLGNANDEVYQLRIAQLSEYIHDIYNDKARSWLKNHPEDVSYVQRLTYALFLWQKEQKEENLVDAWLSFKTQEHYDRLFSSVNDSEAKEFCLKPENSDLLYRLLVSGFLVEDFPTLSDLIDLMKTSPKRTHNREKIFELATRLSVWTKKGSYGVLFDGATTLDIKKKVVHFELGMIPESMKELKTACGLLITGVIRQKIMTMPRNLRKRLIFEEVARFLDVPGGEQIVSEAYAQLRKFGCQTMAIVQQYAQFKNSRIRPILIGNSKQFFIMRQQDKKDLEDLSKDINLSESAQEAIKNFVLPEYQPEKERHSSLFYYNPTIKPELGGILKYFVSCSLVFLLFLGGCQTGRSDAVSNYDKNQKYREGFDDGRNQAIKQHYWMMQNLHKSKTKKHEQLVPMELPTYEREGVQYEGGTVYVKMEN